jgi:hypothetical protein
MELTNQTPESVAAAAAVLTPQNAPTPAENVRAWWKKARRVYPEATLRAWRFDWAAFIAFCRPRGLLPLPASPATVAAFIEACGEGGKKPATVRRYLATIACAHRAANGKQKRWGGTRLKGSSSPRATTSAPTASGH